MPDAHSVLCAQLTRHLLAIAKFLLFVIQKLLKTFLGVFDHAVKML